MYKKSFLIIIFILFFTLIFNSCKKTTQSSDKLDDVICPLEVGNYWTYQDSVWSFYSHQFRYVKDRKLEITGTTTTTIEGDDYFGYYWNNINTETMTPYENKDIIINEKDGLWKLGYQTPTDLLISKSMWLQYPVEVGDYWQMNIFSTDSDDNIFIRETVIVECIAIDELYITPAAQFMCIVYRYYEETYGDYVYLYFAPNTGLIGRAYEKDGFIYVRRRLKSYNIEE